jgi:phytoene desaturase
LRTYTHVQIRAWLHVKDIGLNTKRVVVIGAGPGGLASAMLLAAQGMQVTVLERLDTVGGRTRVIEKDGYRFDVGATFFLYPDILRTIFSRCGLDLADYVTLKRVDPQYRLAFEGGPDVYATQDLDRLEAEISKLDPEDARNVRRFLERGRAKLKAFTPVLRKPFSSLADYAKLDVMSALKLLGPLRSVDSDLTGLFRDPRTRLAFSFQTKYLGMSPFRCPSLFTILSFLEYEFGIWHPLGGCGQLSEGMAEAARNLGADIRTGTTVQRVMFDGKTATGVETSDGVFEADAVVVNADFAANIPKLIPAHLRRRWSDEKIEKAKLSCSTFMLYLGIDGQYPELDHHTIFLSKDYRRNISEIESGARPPSEPSIYVQNPCRTDPAFGDSLRSSLYVLVPVGHCGDTDWAAQRQSYRDLVVSRLEHLGLPGLSQRIRTEKIVTPDDWTTELAIHKGATFNLSHGLDQLLYFRPHNRFQDVDGVYLVGGGTHPGSGLPVIYEGARITADLILKDFGMPAAASA